MEVLRRCQAMDADLPVIIITGHGDVTLAVEAMRSGAYDFIQKPFSTPSCWWRWCAAPWKSAP
jgi:FixJ family two-component response regulator